MSSHRQKTKTVLESSPVCSADVVDLAARAADSSGLAVQTGVAPSRFAKLAVARVGTVHSDPVPHKNFDETLAGQLSQNLQKSASNWSSLQRRPGVVAAPV